MPARSCQAMSCFRPCSGKCDCHANASCLNCLHFPRHSLALSVLRSGFRTWRVFRAACLGAVMLLQITAAATCRRNKISFLAGVMLGRKHRQKMRARGRSLFRSETDVSPKVLTLLRLVASLLVRQEHVWGKICCHLLAVMMRLILQPTTHCLTFC